MKTAVLGRKTGIFSLVLVLLVASAGSGLPLLRAESEAPSGRVQLKSPSRGISSVIDEEPAWYSRPDAMPQPRIPDTAPRAKPPSEPRASWKPNYYYPSMWD